jgi:N-acetyl-anhydromuramyl-L-alanine amidase AmpD|tara:strand:- start:2 stop:562 length:561 start_codon:yes stop_codon:yes gene_type:complete
MKYIALHHTAVKGGAPQLYAVNRYHKGKWDMKSKLGWYVGYNFFCEKDGTRTQTRKIGEETIANRGHNCDVPSRCDTISYCMAGHFDSEVPTDAQDKDFIKFIKEMKEKYPEIKVVGHRNLQANRTCPGANIKKKDFKIWNDIGFSDKLKVDEDREKEKVANLQSQLDILWKLLAQLMKIIKARKN